MIPVNIIKKNDYDISHEVSSMIRPIK